MKSKTVCEEPSVEELDRLEADFDRRIVATPDGARVSMRERGNGPAIVCLHGIGSGAASWLDCASRLASEARVLAWDAPGYGASSPLVQSAPQARHYGARLVAWLDAMEIDECVLVGHSLGAIMAVAALSLAPTRFRSLVLISPATGYGAPGQELMRKRVHDQRLDTLDELGIAGMAGQRSSHLVSPSAAPLVRQWVYWNMARLHEGGYRQAIEMLCGADLLAALRPIVVPVRVACGEADEITTPSACAEVAQRCGVQLELIARAGHASHVEQPEAVARLLLEVAQTSARARR